MTVETVEYINITCDHRWNEKVEGNRRTYNSCGHDLMGSSFNEPTDDEDEAIETWRDDGGIAGEGGTFCKRHLAGRCFECAVAFDPEALTEDFGGTAHLYCAEHLPGAHELTPVEEANAIARRLKVSS